MSIHENYITRQIGGQVNGFDNYMGDVKRPVHYQQQGGGVGDFLRGLFCSAVPVIKRGVAEAGKTALHTSEKIIDVVAIKKLPIKDAFRKWIREGGGNLKRRAQEFFEKSIVGGNAEEENEGYKKRPKKQKPQSLSDIRKRSRKQKKKKKKETRSARDILEVD